MEPVLSQTKQRPDAALREREARLQLLIGQAPAVVWTTDTALRFTSSQGAMLATLGYGAEQLVGMTLAEFFQTDDANVPPIGARSPASRPPMRRRRGGGGGIAGSSRSAMRRAGSSAPSGWRSISPNASRQRRRCDGRTSNLKRW